MTLKTGIYSWSLRLEEFAEPRSNQRLSQNLSGLSNDIASTVVAFDHQIRAIRLLDQVLQLVDNKSAKPSSIRALFSALNQQLLSSMDDLLQREIHSLGSCCEALGITIL